MKTLYLSVPCDFSEAAIEQSIIKIKSKEKRPLFSLELYISVFDVQLAVEMMIDKKRYFEIMYIHIRPDYSIGEYCLKDSINDVCVKGDPV